MTMENFLEALSLNELRDFFCSLDESTQHDIFTCAVVDGCNYSDDEFFYESELEDIINNMSPIEAFELGKDTGNYSGNYFKFGIYGIEFFDDAEDYMLDYLDEMADYIRENYADELAEYFEFDEDEDEDEE